MIKCIAIDDEPLALAQIVSYIEKTPFLKLIGKFDNAVSAMDFLSTKQPDVMFVDISMPDLSGMDFVKSLKNPPRIVFTTAFKDYALEGFKVNATDYLLKPISYADFLKASNRVRDQLIPDSSKPEKTEKTDKYLFIKSEYRIIKIEFDQILYIESMREYVRIFIENKKPVMSLISMKKIMSNLPEGEFMRVHRSYIVNLSKISLVERFRIIFDHNIYIPVSEQYKQEFQKFLDEKFLK